LPTQAITSDRFGLIICLFSTKITRTNVCV